MTLAIIIISYWLWLGETRRINIILSGALITLLSWQQNTVWGICMLCITTLITVAIMINIKNNYISNDKYIY
jgi:hypothetical protein